jgi:hypothetical protein
MLTLDQDIRQEILTDWAILTEHRYPEDLLTEWADNAVPIYTNDIITEWTDLPSDYDGGGREYLDDTLGDKWVIDLMRLDLYAYYQSRYSALYYEIKTEKEEEEID